MDKALLELLRDLVAIDSTSTRSNVPMVEALEKRLAGSGLTLSRQSYVDGAGIHKVNLVAQTGDGPAEIALVGHSDCVPFDSSWREALTLTERDGMLYGRGACDTKAFIAASVIALGNVKSKLSKRVALLFTADEELGCVGAKKLSESKIISVKQAVIGEPTSLTPVRANKGYCLAEIQINGKEGHSAYPDSGASAVFRASRFLVELERYAKNELRTDVRNDFEPAFTTVNVGMIQGGKAKNVIAGGCTLTLEWRPIPGQSEARVLDDVKSILAACERGEPGFSSQLQVLRTDAGFDTEANAPVVQHLSALSGKQAITVSFGTEGPQLAAMGAVPVVFGPGDIKVAHQTGEHVPLVELLRAEQILEGMLLRFASE